MSWKTELIRPIVPPKGKPIITLSDARDYILKLPKSRHDDPIVLAGTEAVLMAAEGRGPIFTAQAGVAQIVHGPQKPLNRPKPDAHWGRRKQS